MIQIEQPLKNNYIALLRKNGLPEKEHSYHLKWLRYYLDFCHKYDFDSSDSNSLPPFIEKLSSRQQNENQQQQATNAVRFFYSLIKEGCFVENSEPEIPEIKEHTSPYFQVENDNRVTDDNAENNISNAEQAMVQPEEKVKEQIFNRSWQEVYQGLENEIKVRHYSPKTLKSYKNWVRKLQTFTRSKDPELLNPSDVKKFLSYLAVEQNVSASSQNLAFNSLLFFFRHILGKEFGKIDGVVRAKKRPYIPVVLSRNEVNSVIANLKYPYDIVVKLLYGCGLRLFECLNLRVNNFDFDGGILTVHDGKGKKNRTLPLPQVIIPELKAHMERVANLHKRDIDGNYDGAFMFDSLEKKFKNAGKEFIWQWFFPAKLLTYVKETNEYRRYHLHETHVQRNLKKAAADAKLTKRATSHTFRHSYASHLLAANYDIRTIQELLGHSDIRTTMIYTYTVVSKTIKEPRSPLDF